MEYVIYYLTDCDHKLICYYDNIWNEYINKEEVSKNFKISKNNSLFSYNKENGENLYDKFTKSTGLEIDSLFKCSERTSLCGCFNIVRILTDCGHCEYFSLTELYSMKLAIVDGERLLFLWF